MNNNCIFCKICAKIIPSNTVYEDENFVGILDISPSNHGHIIVIPKKHMENIFELEENVAKELMPVVAKISNAVKNELNCEGINILQNNGAAAGQTVNHYHMHIIPRNTGDGVVIEWNHLTYQEGEASDLAKRIAKAISYI